MECYRKIVHTRMSTSFQKLGDSVPFSCWKKVVLLFGRFCIVLVFIVLSWTKGAGIVFPFKFPPWYLWIHCNNCHVAPLLRPPHWLCSQMLFSSFSRTFLYPYGYSGSSAAHIFQANGWPDVGCVRSEDGLRRHDTGTGKWRACVPCATLALCLRLFLRLRIVMRQFAVFTAVAVCIVICWVLVPCNLIGSDFCTEDGSTRFHRNVGNHVQFYTMSQFRSQQSRHTLF
jgi:hypothetical protein